MKVLNLIVLALSAVYLSQAQNTGKWAPLECSNGHYTLPRKILKQLSPCIDPAKYGQGPGNIGKIHPSCGFYCALEVIGLLNEHNQTTIAIYDDWVAATFPEQYQEDATAHYRNCYQKFGTQIANDGDDCKSAGEYLVCTTGVVSLMPC